MPTDLINVEIKAVARDIENVKEIAAKLSESSGTLIEQEDTFFNCTNGRLKLRHLKGCPSQLIQYERPDETGPKTSLFNITEIHNPQDLKVTLGKAVGVLGEVKKRRMLYMVGQTRIHVDQVDGLGDYMELEVMMKEGQSMEEGQKIAEDLMAQLGVKTEDLISVAYMDLILQKHKQNGTGDH